MLPLHRNQSQTLTKKVMTVQYKGFVITRQRKDGNYDALRAESSDMEYAFEDSSYQAVIDWIDFKMDGREPEGYFNQY